MNEYTPEMVRNAEAAGHHENARYMRDRIAGNVHRLPAPPRTPFQVQQDLQRDVAEVQKSAYAMGYAVGRFDGYKAAAAFTGPVFLVGVGLGCIIAVVAGSVL